MAHRDFGQVRKGLGRGFLPDPLQGREGRAVNCPVAFLTQINILSR
jgi:hypothetical protein